MSTGDEAALTRRDEMTEPLASEMVRQLKRALRDDQNEVLHNLRRRRRPTSVLPDQAEQGARYKVAVMPLLEAAAREGARFAASADGRGASTPEGDPAAQETAAETADELVAELVEPLRERVQRALTDEVGESDDDGADNKDDELVERLSACYRQWKSTVEELARHHVLVAFGRGAFAATAEGTSLRWVVDDDGRCPDCDDNALAGATPKDRPYPTGQLHPPAHPGCRCVLLPA